MITRLINWQQKPTLKTENNLSNSKTKDQELDGDLNLKKDNLKIEVNMKNRLTIEQVYMGRDKQFPNDFTEEIQQNIALLVDKVNKLLEDLNWQKKVEVSSGWRPPQINSKVSNAAPKSAHQVGMAVDIIDDSNQSLCLLIEQNPGLLKKYDLWMEAKEFTKGKNTNWCHLDFKNRTDRPVRIFKP
jgi:uncharacterized protein YcbK (DUF882 family)